CGMAAPGQGCHRDTNVVWTLMAAWPGGQWADGKDAKGPGRKLPAGPFLDPGGSCRSGERPGLHAAADGRLFSELLEPDPDRDREVAGLDPFRVDLHDAELGEATEAQRADVHAEAAVEAGLRRGFGALEVGI